MGISLFHNDRVLRSHLDVAVDQVDVGRITIGPLVPGWLGAAAPAVAGGAVLAGMTAVLVAGGLTDGELTSLFLATTSLVLVALVAESGRLGSVIVAAAQVPLTSALLYAANAGSVSIAWVYGVHAVVLAVMLADAGVRKDLLARAWWGAELVALMLWLF